MQQFITKSGKIIVYDEKKLYQYGLNKLSLKEYSKKELFNKMKRFQADSDLVNKVLERLEKNGFQSDERKINSIFNYYKNKEGLKKIKLRFTEKGIDKEVIEKFLNSLENTQESADKEVEQAFSTIVKKYKQYDKQKHQKIFGFLLRKGYDYKHIALALNKFSKITNNELGEEEWT